MRDTLVSSFSYRAITCAVMRMTFAYARAYACRVVSYARVCTCSNYAIPASYARHATDSNPVYCSPFAVAFPTYFNFLTFPTTLRTGRERERRDDTRQKTAKSKSVREDETRARRDHEKSRNIVTPFISSRQSGRGVESSVSRKCPATILTVSVHKNARMACSRNDDVSNFALYILTDVTLLS